MLVNTINLLLSLILLFSLIFFLMNLDNKKVRKLKSSNNVLWKNIFVKVKAAGFEYEDPKIRQLVLYYIVVAGMIGFSINPLGVFISPVFAIIGLYAYLLYKERLLSISLQQINDELCYSIARRLRSGESLIDALKNVQKQYKKIKLVRYINKYIDNGYSVELAIEKTITNNTIIKNESEKMLCGTIVLAHQMGGNSARIFERIGDCFHHTYELLGDTKSTIAQVKMSAMVISILPIGFLGLSTIMGLGGSTFLFDNPLGIMCLITGIGMEVIGIM